MTNINPPGSRPGFGPTTDTGTAGSDRSVLAALTDGFVRAVNATRTTPRQVRLRGRFAAAAAREARAKTRANRAMRLEAAAETSAANTAEVQRALPAPLAAMVTFLLMVTSLLTLATILAVSDVPTVEAWLLPAAFGPVFVLITKLLVSWLFTSTQDKPRTTRRTARLLITVLLIGLGAVVAGVAVKSMVIGADEPLTPIDAMASSAAMFGAVVLAEGVGAAVLAAVQHAPGAREWEVARRALTHVRRNAAKAIDAAFAAQRVRVRLEALLAGWQEWAAGRGALAHAFAHHQAVKLARPDDPILSSHTLEAVYISAPAAGLLPIHEDPAEIAIRRWGYMDGRRDFEDLTGGADIDAEFRRLLADQDTTPTVPDSQDALW